MNCIIIEDQTPAQRIIKKYIADIGTIELKACFSNAIDALEFLKNDKVDLIFLDIHLPKISGFDFLKSLTNPPAVILTTAFTDYAVQSYELHVVDYLVKPFSFERFVQAVHKVIPPVTVPATNNEAQEFYIKTGYDYIKINPDEVLFINSDMDYTEIHMEKTKHLTSETLAYWENKLNANTFARVHKSYLINTTKIEKISSNQIYLNNGSSISIGRAYKDRFLSRFVK